MPPPPPFSIRRLGIEDADLVLAAAALFDRPPDRAWTELFLSRGGHHLLIAYVDEAPAGFITGIEVTHPDKGTEMMLYELGVNEELRRRGIGRALVTSLRGLAYELGCSVMWVPTEAEAPAAQATYRSAGASEAEPASIQTWELNDRPGS